MLMSNCNYGLVAHCTDKVNDICQRGYNQCTRREVVCNKDVVGDLVLYYMNCLPLVNVFNNQNNDLEYKEIT